MIDLVLFPLVTPRRPAGDCAYLTVGYALRLGDGGFGVAADDPLLANFGIVVAQVETMGCEAALGDDAFRPGRPVALSPGIDGARDEVSVWSADGVHLAGSLDGHIGAQLAAAVEFGLPLQALVLTDRREADSGEHIAIHILVCPSPQVRIRKAEGELLVPERVERRRLVLMAGDAADLHLWDATGGRGPADPDDLGLSPWLHRRLDNLRGAVRERADAADDEVLPGWIDDMLEEECRNVWRRLRAELGSLCDVGYLGPGMHHPLWDVTEDAEDDIRF